MEKTMTQQQNNIKVITFDLDDTLWHVKPVLIKAEEIVFNWLSERAPKVSDQFSAESFRDWKWDLYKKQPNLTNKISQMRIFSVEQVLLYVGYEKKIATQYAAESFEIFLDARHQVTLFDEVLPLLKALHGRYSLGVLTNGNADVNRLDIGKLFDFSFSAEQLNASKPAADHFEAAQKTSGAKASEIIHIGDHIEHDVVGARLAGCHAIWFNPKKKSREFQQHSFTEVHSLSEIPAAIKKLEESLSQS